MEDGLATAPLPLAPFLCRLSTLRYCSCLLRAREQLRRSGLVGALRWQETSRQRDFARYLDIANTTARDTARLRVGKFAARVCSCGVTPLTIFRSEIDSSILTTDGGILEGVLCSNEVETRPTAYHCAFFSESYMTSSLLPGL